MKVTKQLVSVFVNHEVVRPIRLKYILSYHPMPWYPDVLPMVSSPRCEKCTVHQYIFVKLKGHIGVGFADLIGFFRNI